MFLNVFRRRWPTFLVCLIVFSVAALALTRAPRAGDATAEARLILSDERRVVSADELASILPGDVREFDSSALFRLEESPDFAGKTRLDQEGNRVRVRSSGPDAERAKALVNSFVRTASDESRTRAVYVLQAAKEELGRRSLKLGERAELLAMDQGATESQARNQERRIAAVNAAAIETERQIEEVRARQDRTMARIRALEADEHRLREALPTGPEEDSLKSPVLDRIRKEINSIRAEIALQNLDRAPESPEYRKRSARLGELGEAWRAELYRVRGQTILALKESLNDLEAELRNLDERRMRKSLELRDLEEERRGADPKRVELAAVRKEFEGLEVLRRKLERAMQARQGTIAIIESEASVSAGALPAGGSGALWGLLVALVLAAGATFLRDGLDRKIRSDGDVKRYLNLPTLALAEEDRRDPLILRASPQEASSEAFSMAATMLRSYFSEREFKTCVVTSAAPREGKTTVASNLAVALARKGFTVALVDADLRAPRVHEIFAIDNAQGLSTVLLGGDLDVELAAGVTELPTLRVLPSGPLTELPPEILESQRMVDILQKLRERYDAIILDAPPVTAASDALTLARIADTTILVVRSGLSDRGRVAWAKTLLKNVRADLVGAVLTGTPSTQGQHYAAYPASA